MDALQELWADFLQSTILSMVLGGYGFLEGAFSYTEIASYDSEAGAYEPNSLWYAVVGGEITYVSEGTGEVIDTFSHPGMLNIVVVAMIPLLVIFIGLQMITSVIRASSAGFLRALIMMVVSVPATYIATGLQFAAIVGTTRLTDWILNVGIADDEANDGQRAIFDLFGILPASEDMPEDRTFTTDDGTRMVMDESSVVWNQGWTENPGEAVMPMIIAAVLFLCALILALMMMFRLVALLVLTVFISPAIFSLAWEASKSIFSRWIWIVIALLLAEPAAAVIIRFGSVVGIFGSDWVQIAIGIVLIIMAAAMPVMTLTMTAFMSGGASDGMDKAAVGVGAMTQAKALSSSKRMAGKAGRNITSPVRNANARRQQGKAGQSNMKGQLKEVNKYTTRQDRAPKVSAAQSNSQAGGRAPRPTQGPGNRR